MTNGCGGIGRKKWIFSSWTLRAVKIVGVDAKEKAGMGVGVVVDVFYGLDKFLFQLSIAEFAGYFFNDFAAVRQIEEDHTVRHPACIGGLDDETDILTRWQYIDPADRLRGQWRRDQPEIEKGMNIGVNRTGVRYGGPDPIRTDLIY
jgi:hypothetical protein